MPPGSVSTPSQPCATYGLAILRAQKLSTRHPPTIPRARLQSSFAPRRVARWVSVVVRRRRRRRCRRRCLCHGAWWATACSLALATAQRTKPPSPSLSLPKPSSWCTLREQSLATTCPARAVVASPATGGHPTNPCSFGSLTPAQGRERAPVIYSPRP